jgi:hypothetical protein
MFPADSIWAVFFFGDFVLLRVISFQTIPVYHFAAFVLYMSLKCENVIG